jgi:hypothetical protein
MPKPVHLCQEEIYIAFGDSCRRDDVSEEVWSSVVGLVSHHEGTRLHHSRFHDGTHLSEFLLSCCRVRHFAQTSGNVPETDVYHFRFHDQVELVGLVLDALHHVLRQLHQPVHVLLEAVVALGSPLQPQFEDVVVAAALDHLVAGVVSDVIQFILHKQIIRRHLVAAHQQALQSNVNMCHKGDWGRLRLL